MRDLGANQAIVLEALGDHGGVWHVGCGWLFGTPSQTARVLDTLVDRGLVTSKPYGKYGNYYKIVRAPDASPYEGLDFS